MTSPVAPTVFIVDDDAGVRTSIQDLLDSFGLRSEGFGTAERFLRGCYASCPTMSEYPPAAPSSPSWTAIGWLLGKSALATKTEGTPLSEGLAPNALWCTDHKGEFMLGDKR
jgi:hypothetical protein